MHILFSICLTQRLLPCQPPNSTSQCFWKSPKINSMEIFLIFFFLWSQSMTCVHSSLSNYHSLCGSQALLMCSFICICGFLCVFVNAQNNQRKYLQENFLKMAFLSQNINADVVSFDMVIFPCKKIIAAYILPSVNIYSITNTVCLPFSFLPM